jgi:hypothetical protein
MAIAALSTNPDAATISGAGYADLIEIRADGNGGQPPENR